MSAATPGSPASSPLPRLLHLLVFAGFALVTASLISPEIAQLIASQRAPYHFGDPPRALALLSGALLLPALAVLLWRVVRGRSAPLWTSGLVLASAVLAVVSAVGEVPRGRTWAAADVRILEVTRELQQRMLARVQMGGRLPQHVDNWREALAEVAEGPSPARTRSFSPVPYQLVLSPEQGRVPEGLAPGTVVAWLDPQGDAFELTPVGFAKDGTVGPLVDDQGERVVLRGGTSAEQGSIP
jgi:hypothetical protein